MTREKLTRISYNSADWRRPTGDARKYEARGTYNREHGFGHEDWLFRSEWLIDGWRYAFLQGVNKSRQKLLRHTLDLTLYTIEPDKRRRYVANIYELECLSDEQAREALSAFRRSGWLDTMRREVNQTGGTASALGDPQWAEHILNVRFRVENVVFLPPETFAEDNNAWFKNRHRYLLYDFAPEDLGRLRNTFRRRSGSRHAPTIRTFFRRQSGASAYTPEHRRMQAKLMKELKLEFPHAEVVREEDFVDVIVRTKTKLILFEIKSDLAPRSVIRHALGQVLEYAYHPTRTHNLPLSLVIVGRHALTRQDQDYLKRLQTEFALPLNYRVVGIA